MSGFRHLPVLRDEVVNALKVRTGGLIVDGTLGGGGHAEAILQNDETVRVVGLDQDDEALAASEQRLKKFEGRIMIEKTNYQNARSVLNRLGIDAVDGVLLDLGVSSHQLDTAARGFSFNKDGPLDMRMDQSGGTTAADIVNTATESGLERIFREYGEEPRARGIARAIVRRRAEKPFTTTLDLAGHIEKVTGGRRGKTHPATKVFQALRIEVNQELGVLRGGLDSFSGLLAPGGRFAVITFHSLEDRMVKHYFRDNARETIDNPAWPAPRPNPARIFKQITRKAVEASEDEIVNNPRARSAKLRVVEKL